MGWIWEGFEERRGHLRRALRGRLYINIPGQEAQTPCSNIRMFELFPWGGPHEFFTDFGLLGGGNEGSNIQMFELSVGRYPGFRADFGLQEEGGSQMFELQGPNALNRENPWGGPHGKKERTFEYSNMGFRTPARDVNIKI